MKDFGLKFVPNHSVNYQFGDCCMSGTVPSTVLWCRYSVITCDFFFYLNTTFVQPGAQTSSGGFGWSVIRFGRLRGSVLKTLHLSSDSSLSHLSLTHACLSSIHSFEWEIKKKIHSWRARGGEREGAGGGGLWNKRGCCVNTAVTVHRLF